MNICLKMLFMFSNLVMLYGCETDSLFRGYRFFQRRQYDRAVSQFTYYLNHSEDREDNKEYRAAGYLYRGLSQSTLGCHELAIADYKDALLRVEDCFYASFNLGVELLKMQEYEKSKMSFLKAWEGILKAKRGDLNDSQLWNRKTLDRDCEFCFQYCGMLLLKMRDLDGLNVLIEDFRKLSMKIKRKSTREMLQIVKESIKEGFDVSIIDVVFQEWERKCKYQIR